MIFLVFKQLYHSITHIFIKVVDGGRAKTSHINPPLQPMADIPSQIVYGSCQRICHSSLVRHRLTARIFIEALI
jgi:hypothetical protein